MKNNPGFHHRHGLRLRDFDYSRPGGYFFTICTKERACLLGEVVDGEMRLNESGQIVQTVWNYLPRHYPQTQLDGFIVMPNHVHGIIFIVEQKPVVAGLKPATTNPPNSEPTTTMGRNHGLSEIVRGFKTFSSRSINEKRGTPGATVWQRNFFDHIIRDEDSLYQIRQYILNNPARWTFDRDNPEVAKPHVQPTEFA